MLRKSILRWELRNRSFREYGYILCFTYCFTVVRVVKLLLHPFKATFLAAGSAGVLSDAVSNAKKHTNLGLINFEVVLRSVFTFCFLEVTA